MIGAIQRKQALDVYVVCYVRVSVCMRHIVYYIILSSNRWSYGVMVPDTKKTAWSSQSLMRLLYDTHSSIRRPSSLRFSESYHYWRIQELLFVAVL